MRSPQRIYQATHIAAGVKAVARLQQKVLEAAPMSAGPMAALATQQADSTNPAPVPEMLEGHCLGCGGKKSFTVDGSDVMKNGAIRKSGKCTGDGCNRTISTFVSGKTDGQ